MIRNHFLHESAAERYARERPYVHPTVVRRIAPLVGAVERALDVGCGTGMSTRALAPIARVVVGVDPSLGMLACAESSAEIRYAVATAEVLPFDADTFDLLTAGLAFHWFDRARFLPEAARVLRPAGWMTIYNSWFGGAMRENPAFAEWLRSRFLERFPTPPRNREPLSMEELAAHGFELIDEGRYEHDVRMSPERLVGYLTTQTNIIAALEAERTTLAEIGEWLLASVSPMFSGEAATFPFGVSYQVLRNCAASGMSAARGA